MPSSVASELILLAVLAAAPLAQADDLSRASLSEGVIKNDLALLKTLLAEQHSQDELDFSLIVAAGRGRSEAALLLLASGANPKRQVAPHGFSSIVESIRNNHLETLIVLLEHGGDPNETDQRGWQPLHHTIGLDYERPDTIHTLVKHGAVVDSRDRLQRTALHRAAGLGHAESVRVLLAVGANPLLRDKNGYSAARRAILAGHRNVAQLIQSHR